VGELQQYIAVGTNRGHVNIYESHNITKAYIYTRFKNHKDKVTSIQFHDILNDKSDMLFSTSLDGTLNLYCLIENQLLSTFKIGGSFVQCIKKRNWIILRQEKNTVFQIELLNRQDKLKQVQNELAHNL